MSYRAKTFLLELCLCSLHTNITHSRQGRQSCLKSSPLTTTLKACYTSQGEGATLRLWGQSPFHHAEVFCEAKMHQIYVRPRLCSGPCWGSLRCFLGPPDQLGREILHPHSPLNSTPAAPRPLPPLENFLHAATSIRTPSGYHMTFAVLGRGGDHNIDSTTNMSLSVVKSRGVDPD